MSVVYAPAERAETFSLFPLSPFLLCVRFYRHVHGLTKGSRSTDDDRNILVLPAVYPLWPEISIP
jgi:hypothetical protein